jgi:hypothetical protein
MSDALFDIFLSVLSHVLHPLLIDLLYIQVNILRTIENTYDYAHHQTKKLSAWISSWKRDSIQNMNPHILCIQ